MVAPLAERRADGLAPVYDRYAPALHAYCRSLLGDPSDADDAVQDTFIIAAAELDELRDPGLLGPGSMPWPATNAATACVPARWRPGRRGGRADRRDGYLAADAERAQLRAATAAASPRSAPATGRSSS